MRNGLFKRDNRGSALVLVIISMLFIGIIASIVLFVSRSNLIVSDAGKNSSTNFYQGEVYMDELKTKLKELADKAVQEAYKDWLRDYTTKYAEHSITEQSDLFYELFIEKFKELDEVKNYFDFEGNPVVEKKPLGELLLSADSGITPMGTPTLEIDKDDITGKVKDIRIKGISVTNADDRNDKTTISTDLLLTVEIPSITVLSGIRTNFTDFAFITDYSVKFDAQAARIVGSIYGGGKSDTGYDSAGIYVRGRSPFAYGGELINPDYVELDSGLIITRTSIETTNDACLRIYGKNGKSSSGTNVENSVWAKNILMGKKNTGTDLRSGQIEIQAKCYLADDLTLDGNKSEFKLEKGSQYIGYSYNTSSAADKAGDSSSIVVNGENASLDLSNADRLWLFGKSYVEVPTIWGYIKDSSQDVFSRTFMQGESIAARSLQAAYLLPGECINEIHHNPMTEDEYKSLLVDPTNLKSSELKPNSIDIDKMSYVGISLRDHLKKDNPFSVASVKYGTGANDQTLWYFYMNFSSPDKAADYMHKYVEKFDEIARSRVDLSRPVKLLVNTANKGTNANGDKVLDNGAGRALEEYKVINTGNILTYDPSAPAADKMVFWPKNVDYSNQFILTQRDSLKRKYQSYCVALESGMIGSLSTDLTDSIVNYKYIEKECEDAGMNYSAKRILEDSGQYGYSLTGLEADKRGAYIITATKDVTISSGGKIKVNGSDVVIEGDSAPYIAAGIIITEGKVTFENTATFWGTIIAKKGIEVQGTCENIQAAGTYLQRLLSPDVYNEQVVPYFTTNDRSSADDAISTETFININYDNWKKD